MNGGCVGTVHAEGSSSSLVEPSLCSTREEDGGRGGSVHRPGGG